MQAMPEYRGTTTFIITTDHGRGSGPEKWRDHGKDVDGAEDIWIAVLGPDTPALGERAQAGPVTQSQVAATIAALLGVIDCTNERSSFRVLTGRSPRYCRPQ